jgi:hypothetical protein
VAPGMPRAGRQRYLGSWGCTFRSQHPPHKQKTLHRKKGPHPSPSIPYHILRISSQRSPALPCPALPCLAASRQGSTAAQPLRLSLENPRRQPNHPPGPAPSAGSPPRLVCHQPPGKCSRPAGSRLGAVRLRLRLENPRRQTEPPSRRGRRRM